MKSKYSTYQPEYERRIFEDLEDLSAKEWNQKLKKEFPQNIISCSYNHMIYVISDNKTDVCKIGIATNPHQRLRTLQQGNPSILYAHKLWYCGRKLAITMEKLIHEHLDEYRLSKITNQTSGHNEWFTITKDEGISFVDSMLHTHEFNMSLG